MSNLHQLALVFFISLHVGQFTLCAQPITLSEATKVYDLGNSLRYFRDAHGNTPDSVVLSEDWDRHFLPSNKKVLNFGVTKDVIWVTFKLKNPTLQSEWILLMKNAMMDSLILYTQVEKKWRKRVAGDLLPFRQREINDHELAFSLSLPDTTTRTYYLRMTTSGSMQIPLLVYTPNEFHRARTVSQMLYGIFTGALLIMFLYNLVVFLSLRDYSYLAYSLFILINLALMNAYSGHLFQYLFPNHPLAANHAIPILMSLIAFSVPLFSLLYLNPKEITPTVRWALFLFCGVSLILAASSFLVPIRQSTSLAGILIILVLITCIVAGISSLRHGNVGARFYLLAWGLLITSGLLTAFRNFGLIDSNFLTLHGSRIAALLEVALLSISLAERYTRFRRDKELVQLELIETQQRVNRELEEKVAVRTQQLSETLQKVEIEREKSDLLLLNVLPKEIMLELKANGKIRPRSYEMATILFADIQNFSRIAENLKPEDIIRSLDECFLAFDDICRKHNLEKIKTMGDGYMAVGGIPVVNDSNPFDAVMAGLEMQNWMRTGRINDSTSPDKAWQIRIGINTGSAIAGVIGKHKFVYDIWGDSVNLASRIESSGEVGEVNISSNTYHLIKDQFICQYKGKIPIKNKAEEDLYQVLKIANRQ